ncbi:MAG: ATP-binding protein [Chitinophagaceae bacterium]
MKKRERETCNELIEKKELEKNLAILQSRQEERTRISADLHDDLGAGLTSVRIYSELAKERISNQMPELEKISSLSNELINRMNAIIWTMDQSNDSLDNLVCYLRKIAIEYFEDTKINCIINTPENIPTLEVSGERRRNIYLILNELLANVLKHSAASEVKIDLEFDTELTLVVSDNGNGFTKSLNGKQGNGIKNIRKRLEMLGGKMEIDGNGGTRVETLIPLF